MKADLNLAGLSHHSYCLVSPDPAIETVEYLAGIISSDYGIKISGNSDFIIRKYQNLTIEDARELKSIHDIRPISNNGKKIFILSASSLTVEAQNALLKLLEEPASYAIFFLIVPSTHIILPTVKSRLKFIEMKRPFPKKSDGASKVKKDAPNFLEMTASKKMSFIKDLMDDVNKEKKTRQDVIDFLVSLQKEIYNSKSAKNKMKKHEAVELALKYANDRSPSMKMLLEYVALMVSQRE